MNPDKAKVRIIMATLTGVAAGFLVLHPYTMLVYVLHERQGVVLEDLFQALAFTFDPAMLDMGIPFALLGAVTGLLYGLWRENRNKRVELEKQLARWMH